VSEPSIHQALAAVMADVGAVGKGRRIEQGPAKYAYRGIEDMLSKIQPAFVKHGVVCFPRVLSAEYRDGTTKNGGSTREATLHVQFTFVGPAGDRIEAITVGEATDTSDKASNKAMTAAYKYALLLTLAIPTELDDQDAERIERGHHVDPAKAWEIAAKNRLVAEAGKERAAELWKANPPSSDAELDALIEHAANTQGEPDGG